jgi:hypothetical protein
MNITVSIISLVVAIVCAFVCYRIAENKGRNGVLWAVLGFLFSIISLIVIALLPPKRTRSLS